MKLETHLVAETEILLIDLLHSRTELSKTALKKALNFGGVWVKSGGKAKRRTRKANKKILAGDRVSLFFDDSLYRQDVQPIIAQAQTNEWGIWYKPPGVLSQGSPYGDHGSVEHQVEQHRGKGRFLHLVNRLDREAGGLMLIAYDRHSARALTLAWASPDTQKCYQARVLGVLDRPEGVIDHTLDGKSCTTRYRLIEQNESWSNVDIRLSSGRYHQIRRHFADIGHPLLGDPRYGTGNSDPQGLQLLAYRLRFICPKTNRPVNCQLPLEQLLFAPPDLQGKQTLDAVDNKFNADSRHNQPHDFVGN